MKIALPNWQGRVSPVFDVARQLLVVEIEDGRVRSTEDVPLTVADPVARLGVLTGLGINVLVCGVVSRPFADALAAVGIDVMPHMCGDVESVLHAYIAETLAESPGLRMPGCGRGRQRRHGHGWGRGRQRDGFCWEPSYTQRAPGEDPEAAPDRKE